MELFQFLKQSVKKLLYLFNYKRQNKYISEDHYYTNFFIQNENWNKPYPNNEEALRWNIIEKFINGILKMIKTYEKNEKYQGCMPIS